MRQTRTYLKDSKKFKASSQRWLNRQLNDPYVLKAKEQNLRSRASFKLMELQERFHIIKKNDSVLDLGAAPGGWSEVALNLGARTVVGVDLLPILPLEGALFIEGDFQDPLILEKISILFKGEKPNVILSDMAPNTTGHPGVDYLRIYALAELVMDFTILNLSQGGNFVCKVFQGGADKKLIDRLRTDFKTFVHAKPPASRKDSSELYLIAKGKK